MTVTAVTVPGLVDILNSANPVVQWAAPIITVVLALGVGFFGVRFIIQRIQSALNNN